MITNETFRYIVTDESCWTTILVLKCSTFSCLSILMTGLTAVMLANGFHWFIRMCCVCMWVICKLWFVSVCSNTERQLLREKSKYGRDNWRIKNKLDTTYYFIVLLIVSTCFRHYYAHHQEHQRLCCWLPLWSFRSWFAVCWRLGAVRLEWCPGCSLCCSIRLHVLMLN